MHTDDDTLSVVRTVHNGTVVTLTRPRRYPARAVRLTSSESQSPSIREARNTTAQEFFPAARSKTPSPPPAHRQTPPERPFNAGLYTNSTPVSVAPHAAAMFPSIRRPSNTPPVHAVVPRLAVEASRPEVSSASARLPSRPADDYNSKEIDDDDTSLATTRTGSAPDLGSRPNRVGASVASKDDFPWPLTDMAEFEFGPGSASRPLRNYIVLIGLPKVPVSEGALQQAMLKDLVHSRDACVVGVDLPVDRGTGRTKGIAFMELDSSMGAALAASRLGTVVLAGGYRISARLFLRYRGDDQPSIIAESETGSKSIDDDRTPRDLARKLSKARERQRLAEESRISALERLAEATQLNAALRSEINKVRTENESLRAKLTDATRDAEAAKADAQTAAGVAGKAKLADKWALLLQFVDGEGVAAATPRPPGGAKRSFPRHGTVSPPLPKVYSLEQLDTVFGALQGALSRVRAEQVRLAKLQHVETEKELAKLQEAKSCAVCFERDRNTVLLPCGHVVLCGMCARSDDIRDCPVCRSRIERVMDVFM